jgi:MFS family permease
VTTAAAASPRRTSDAALLASLLLLGGANSVLFSVMPPAGRQLGLVEWQVGMIVAFSAAAYMVSAAWWGRISDLRGRRLVVVTGMVGFGLGGLVFAGVLDLGLAAIAPPLLALILLVAVRIGQSALSGGVYPAAQAHIADATPPERRAVAMSAIMAAFALGSVLGPAAAGLLVEIHITLPLYLIGLLGLGVAQWCFLSMDARPATAGMATARLSPGDPRVKVWIAMIALYFVATSGAQQVLGFAVQDRLSLDAADTARMTSWMFMGAGLFAVLFQVFVVRRSGWSVTTLLVLGLAASGAMHAGLIVVDQRWQFLALTPVMGISFACVSPGFSAAASVAVGSHEQGAVAGLVAAAQAAGFLVGPVLLAVLYQLSPASPFVLGLAVAVLLLLFVFSKREVAQ